MTDKYKLQDELQNIVETKPLKEVFSYMENNLAALLSTPYTADYYQILKNIDVSESKSITPKLVMAWLAFLCGDNPNLYTTVKCIKETELLTCNDSSFYYSLKALMGILTDHNERLKYAKLSVDVLPKDDKSFYMANAKLTYGQLLAGFDQFRSAAETFAESYEMFYAMNMDFPAAVALVNELLNRYKLGEFKTVIDKSNNMLIISANFTGANLDCWNIINLPLGMCYFELDKPNLAIRYLKLAKSSIDHMKLLHMHGFTELYLFKSYYIANDRDGMKAVRDEAVSKFGHMHYKRIDLLLSMFNILSFREEDYNLLQPDIELFEIEFMQNPNDVQPIVIEILSYLKFMGLSHTVTVDVIVKCLEKLRFIGMVPYIQLFILFLAELHFKEGRQKEATECLSEASAIYKDFGISASFHMVDLKSITLLKKVNMELYEILTKTNAFLKDIPPAQINDINPSRILSSREKEIMELIAEGKSNDEISKSLYIGIGTIKWHINHIFSKLEVKNRIQAIEKAKTLKEI